VSNEINIEDLDKAEVLLALYNGSHAQGMSFLAKPSTPPHAGGREG
jgi:hypothetical protein